jgi:hypothetical protein
MENGHTAEAGSDLYETAGDSERPEVLPSNKLKSALELVSKALLCRFPGSFEQRLLIIMEDNSFIADVNAADTDSSTSSSPCPFPTRPSDC